MAQIGIGATAQRLRMAVNSARRTKKNAGMPLTAIFSRAFVVDEADLDEFVRQWEEAVSQLYDFALTADKKQGGVLAVSDGLAARFLTEIGINVVGFYRLLDADGLRHIHKQHGGVMRPSPHREAEHFESVVSYTNSAGILMLCQSGSNLSPI